MPATGATQSLQPHPHCALCPGPTFPQLAVLPDLSQLQVYPVTARPQPAAGAPPISTTTAAPATVPTNPEHAEALLIFFNERTTLEAALAALPGVQFFDWSGRFYAERGNAGEAATPVVRPATVTPPDRPAGWRVPTPVQLQFSGLKGLVVCDLPAPQPLWQALRLPAVRALRASGGYRIPATPPQGTPPRGVSFARPTSSSAVNLSSSTDTDSMQVGLRASPAGAETDSAHQADSRALLLPKQRLPELLNWVARTPPLRWQGLLFTLFPDAVWIDNIVDDGIDLPPLLPADRFSPYGGSIGASVWLQTGTRWTPPLATDLILERLQAMPSFDYILWPDLSGALRCRYILERARLQPVDRASLRLAADAESPT